MIALFASFALAASWEHPPTRLSPIIVTPATRAAVAAHVERSQAVQVAADFAREASRIVVSWYEADLQILQRGEYGGQVASLRDDLDRHVALLDAFGVSRVHDGRATVAAAMRDMPHASSDGPALPALLGEWRPSGALKAWADQLDHLATVAERQAFGVAGNDGGAARLAADARWLAAGFQRLRLAGC